MAPRHFLLVKHADHTAALLAQRGARVVRTSLSDYPNATLTWDPVDGIRVDGRVLGFAAGLWRRPASADGARYAPDYRAFVCRETQDAFLGATQASQIRWLTDPSALARAELKLVQLRVAISIGLPVPPTLVTNCASDGVAFAERHGPVVVKPIRYGLLTTGPEARVAYTRRVTASELADLTGSPVILQHEIDAKLHLRVVTVRGDVFVSAVRSEELDWRSDPSSHERFEAVGDLEWPAVRVGALALADRLGIGFSSQDWAVDRQDHAHFLEANPNGQWMFVDSVHHGRPSAAVADALWDAAQHGRGEDC